MTHISDLPLTRHEKILAGFIQITRETLVKLNPYQWALAEVIQESATDEGEIWIKMKPTAVIPGKGGALEFPPKYQEAVDIIQEDPLVHHDKVMTDHFKERTVSELCHDLDNWRQVLNQELLAPEERKAVNEKIQEINDELNTRRGSVYFENLHSKILEKVYNKAGGPMAEVLDPDQEKIREMSELLRNARDIYREILPFMNEKATTQILGEIDKINNITKI